ncbi:DUF3887 domain-containing protein [Corynebacterium ammoniagenes]|uniref:DUF3887 domain-containing protein n=2 Tax=Corynebacterium ammoniagenes TaxID=1697 RepID=A0AAV5G3R7_CORAM|nr:Clp protease [Corynebacterium ammoniagenes DSM 20306]AQS72630.1 DUF3887 domain-containing protein [Corynebacterium ammoniagenes]EFG81919.1 hypothetical protein HMPREF0281_00906 [Corynebacterium ammoniagenes DSM 20306]GJN43723.1 hypothetical protein CAT723_22020 [Corynebacterium ammoniagenes]
MGIEPGHKLAERIQRVATLLAEELAATENEASTAQDLRSDITHALATARSLRALADESLAHLITDARNRGVTWQVIGDALGISRQAAFQRFGTPVDPRTGEAMNKPSKHRRDEARAQAESFLDALTAHQWENAAQQLGPVIGSQLDAEGLAATWAQVTALGGELEARLKSDAIGLPDDIIVVEQHLAFEAADLVARLSYNADGTMAGLWFVPAEQALTERPHS